MKKEFKELCEKRLKENVEPEENVLGCGLMPNTGIPETSKFYGKFILDSDDIEDFAQEHNLQKNESTWTVADYDAIEKVCGCKFNHHDEYENEEENVFLGEYSAYEVVFN